MVENKPGAGGNIGTEYALRAPADGYTLIVNSVGPMAVNSTLYKNLSYDPLVDLVPIAQISDVPNVLVVHPSTGVKGVKGLIAYAKPNAGRLNYEGDLPLRDGARIPHVAMNGRVFAWDKRTRRAACFRPFVVD